MNSVLPKTSYISFRPAFLLAVVLFGSLIFSNSALALAVHDASATISPTTAYFSQSQIYTYTITNSSSSTAKIGSAEIQLPAGFGTPTLNISSSSSGRTWVLGSSSGYTNGFNSTTRKIGIKADSSHDQLDDNEFVQVQITSTSSVDPSSYEWTASVLANLNFSGTVFSITSSQPTVVVSKADQTITFNSLSNKTYGNSDFSVSASATSGLTATFTASGGCTVSGTTVHITGAGSCTITAHQAGNTDYNAAPDVSNIFTVLAKGLTITGIVGQNKVYDGTTSATFTGTATLSGVINSDDVALGGTSAANFADKTAASAKTITITGYTLSGNNAGNYSLTQPVATADITARPLTVSATGVNKAYDGTTNAAVIFSSDKISGDSVAITGTAAFADANVGAGKTVSVSGISISGTDANNYTLSSTTASTTADITKNSATISLDKSNLTRPYNGTAKSVSVLSTAPDSLTYSVTYNGSATLPTNAGSYDVVASINDANYAGSDTATLVITALPITVSADAKSKSYGDADPSLTYQIASGSLVNGDVISGSLTRNAGESVGTYNISVGTLSAGNNYNLTFVSALLTIKIGSANTSAVLSTTANGDGSLSATVPTQTQTSTTSSGVSVNVDIPAGTVISGPAGWDGSITLPAATTVFTKPTPDAGSTVSVASAIAVGAGDTHLTLDKAVRLLFSGQAGYLVGWSQNSVFTRIADSCSTDSQAAGDALSSGSDCKIKSGADLVVWTKHFTSFLTYTQTAIPASSGGSGAGDSGSCSACYERDAEQAAMSTPAPTPAATPALTPELTPIPVSTQAATVKTLSPALAVRTGQPVAGKTSLPKTLAKAAKTPPQLEAAIGSQNIFQKIFRWLFGWWRF